MMFHPVRWRGGGPVGVDTSAGFPGGALVTSSTENDGAAPDGDGQGVPRPRAWRAD